jgi:penicillin-binding protein 1A
MKEVVNAGTARAAQLPGVQVAGKTGTTNAYKDAWFNGYTGNYVGAIWFGNDASTSMRNMTGGSLPARTWREIMEYAHQGIELKNPFGVFEAPREAPRVASNPAPGTLVLGRPQRPVTLSRRSAETLADIDSMMRSSAVQMKSFDYNSTSSIGAPSSIVSRVRLGPPGGAQ